MLGLLGLDQTTAFSGMWPWFLLIGIALGLVVVASTQAIVGNAPVHLGGIAGGLQTTANQLGGVLGTAVLGSIMVAGVGSSLAGHLSDAGVPAAVAGPLSAAKETVAQGIAPVTHAMPASLAAKVTEASQLAFLGALHTAILVAAVVAFAGAGLAHLIKRGHAGEGAIAVA